MKGNDMFCTSCGYSLHDADRFCAQCGKPAAAGETSQTFAAPPRLRQRLERPFEDRKIGGVCAGFANYFGVDVTLMRILWLAGTFYTVGTGIVVYLLCWLVMPVEPPRPAFVPASSTPAS
jgi:phage shock protein C